MAPVWWMIFLILLVLFYLYELFIVDRVLPAGFRMRFKFLVVAGVFVSVLMGEAIAYWYIRKRQVQKKLVWLHIVSLLLALIILPVMYTSVVYYWEELFSREPWRSFVFNVKNILSLFFLIIGHAFFITMLVKVFTQGKKEPVDVQDTEILDDYANKFE
jgi:hypothetical protein